MILEEKNTIRKNIKATLQAYKENFSKDSAAIMELILQSPQYKKADTILSYMALPDEVFLDNKKFSSKNVFIPKVRQEDGEMDFYKFDENALETGAYDILEPVTEAATGLNVNLGNGPVTRPTHEKFSFNDLEKYGNLLVLVPGRAFTVQGQRLGRGKGYYDKYLGKLFSLFEKRSESAPGTGHITFAGVCFKPQIMEKLPTEQHDILMDTIFTTK